MRQSRDSALGWLSGAALALSVEAGCTPAAVHRLAAANSASLPSASEQCVQGVCAIFVADGSDFRLSLENRNPLPVTATVKAPVCENLEPSVPLPTSLTLQSHQAVEAVFFKRIDATRPASVQTVRSSYFGSVETSPDAEVRYAMPFGGGEKRKLSQGVNGGISHSGIERYAFDFVMPEGTPVLAARDGIVVSVKDGFTVGAFDPVLKDKVNSVWVAQKDGTIAHYTHLSPGIAVRVGQHVAKDQRLGLSGNTGYTQGPHLHFHVGKVESDMEGYTIPILFEDGTPGGTVPEQGLWYDPSPEVGPRDGNGE